jgi:hypothetical protein
MARSLSGTHLPSGERVRTAKLTVTGAPDES